MIFMMSQSGLCHVKGSFTFTECEWDDFYDVMVWAVPCQGFVYIHRVQMGWFLWHHGLGVPLQGSVYIHRGWMGRFLWHHGLGCAMSRVRWHSPRVNGTNFYDVAVWAVPCQGFVYIHQVQMGRFLWRHGLGCTMSRVCLHSPSANGTIFMMSQSGLCHVNRLFTFTKCGWDDFYDVTVWAVPHQGSIYIHQGWMGWFLWCHSLGCAMSRVCLHSPSANGTIFMTSWSGLCHVKGSFTFTECEWDDFYDVTVSVCHVKGPFSFTEGDWDDFYDVTVWAVPRQGFVYIHRGRMGCFLWHHNVACQRVCSHLPRTIATISTQIY